MLWFLCLSSSSQLRISCTNSGRLSDLRGKPSWNGQVKPEPCNGDLIFFVIGTHEGHEILSFYWVIPIVWVSLQFCDTTIEFSKKCTKLFCEIISSNVALIFTPGHELPCTIPGDIPVKNTYRLNLLDCNRPKKWKVCFIKYFFPSLLCIAKYTLS